MGYAVELFLNEKESRPIREAFAHLGSVLAEMGASPHVSLAVFDEADVDGLIAVTEDFFRNRSVFKMRFSSFGFFPGAEGVVFLAPVVTRGMLDMHEAFHACLARRGLCSSAHYLPGAWVPHCTLAIEQPITRTMENLARMAPSSLPGEYLVDSVHVIQFRPVISRACLRLNGTL